MTPPPQQPVRNAPSRRRGRCAYLVGAVLALACGEGEPGSVNSMAWLTEGEYRFSGDPDRNVLFSQIPVLRADPHRDRVFVLDLQDAELSVWTHDGSLAFVLGGAGEGPGEFTFPTRVEFTDGGGFYVREGWGSRFTFYGADGTLERTDAGGTTALRYQDHGVTLEAPTGRDGYFAVPSIGSSVFVERKIDRYPLLRVRRSDSGGWRVGFCCRNPYRFAMRRTPTSGGYGRIRWACPMLWAEGSWRSP